MATLSYHEQKDIENIKKLRELQKELPSFCSDFFRGIETSTSTRTRIAYAYDLKIFFQFLKTANPGTFDNPSHTLTPSDLEKLTVTDLEEYIDYLKCHPSDTNEDVINTERGLMRKVSSLRSFYSYFFRNERIEKNPAALVRMPKLHEKEIIRLEIDEVAKLLDEVEEGDKLTEKQKLYHERTKVRDLAMMSLLLGTGIRVSVRSVENLVKKYAKLVTPLKKITPHKLRSTYGTSLYRETGDIYLVASVLGHNDVNTTRKHYAAQEEERRRSARNVVRLRES